MNIERIGLRSRKNWFRRSTNWNLIHLKWLDISNLVGYHKLTGSLKLSKQN